MTLTSPPAKHLAELFIIECREGAGRGAHCCCNAAIMDGLRNAACELLFSPGGIKIYMDCNVLGMVLHVE